MSDQESSPTAAYRARVAQYEAELALLDRRGARLGNLRMLAFLTFAGCGFWGGWTARPVLFLPAALALAGFVVLVIIHAGVVRREDFARVKLELNRRGLKRLAGEWRTLDGEPETAIDGHLYAADLNVTGHGSLMHRLDETGTRAGHVQLLTWLLSAAKDSDEVRARQAAVKELAPLIDFRQHLVTEARVATKTGRADPSRFFDWAEGGSTLSRVRWAYFVAHVLPVYTIGAAALGAAGVISGLYFFGGLVAQLLVVRLTAGPIAAMWGALSLGERGFVRFEETFTAIDAQPFSTPKLQALQRGLQDGPPIPALLKKFARLMGFAELKRSGQMHPVINALTLWDLLVLFRLDAWRELHGKGVRRWFDALAELEALCAFATLHFDQPAWCFPEVDDEPVHLDAQALGHPLLDAPVCNDVQFQRPGEAWIITGSNMSGKTTLMRAVGLNTVMALAGLPVCAKAMKVGVAQVLTSMRVKDSLEQGTSYFYAEVKRVKTVLDAAKAHERRCLFFLDELFMGTNAKERLIASRKLLFMLLDLGASGAVTTHDLQLTDLAAERPGTVRNVHFRDEVKDGDMTFDYTLRDGVVQTTNALEVLRRAGVEV